MNSLTKISKMELPPFLQSPNINATSFNASAAFPGIMDTFLFTAGQTSPLMQVFLFVYRSLGAQFGLDPSLLLTFLGLLWGFYKVLTQIYHGIRHFVKQHLICSMNINGDDAIYSHMTEFLSEKESIVTDRYLTASTTWKSAWEEEEDIVNTFSLMEEKEGEQGPQYLNFANHAASTVSGTHCQMHSTHSFTNLLRNLATCQPWEPRASGITGPISK